ncbi:Visinin protein 1 [Globisporangium polare]
MAHAANEGSGEGGAVVKAELSPNSTAAAVTADVKSEAPSAADASRRNGASAKQLKLRLFQQLTRRHRHAWPQYWRALQQYLVARLSVDEFQCIVAILLGPDLVELHNAFIIAILRQTQTSSVSDRTGGGDDTASVLRGCSDGSSTKAAVKEESKEATELLPSVEKEADPSKEDSSHLKGDVHPSESKKRSISSRVSSPDDEKAVKKLLHFANSKRETPEKQSSDHQSAELLIGLGGFGSRTSSHDSGRE